MNNSKILLCLTFVFGSVFASADYYFDPIVCRIYYPKGESNPVCHFQPVRKGDLCYKNALSFDEFVQYGAFPAMNKAFQYSIALSLLTALYLRIFAGVRYPHLYSSAPVENIYGGEPVRRIASYAWKVLLAGCVFLAIYDKKTSERFSQRPILELFNNFQGKRFALYNAFNNYREISLRIESADQAKAFLQEMKYFGQNYNIEIIGLELLSE